VPLGPKIGGRRPAEAVARWLQRGLPGCV